MKAFIKKAIPPHAMGMLEYLWRPQLRESWGGAFNGQTGRTRIFNEILKSLPPAYLVETGAFRGTTTLHISKRFDGPIYTVESNPRAAGFARMALRGRRNVNLIRGSSVDFLAQELTHKVSADQRGIFYLDAHWHGSVPILDELRLIAEFCADPVVMIDDFKVPGDPNYQFDDYAELGALTLEFLDDTLRTHEYHAFFPAMPSAEETGMRRGCVVLARAQHTVEKLGQLSSLSSDGQLLVENQPRKTSSATYDGGAR